VGLWFNKAATSSQPITHTVTIQLVDNNIPPLTTDIVQDTTLPPAGGSTDWVELTNTTGKYTDPADGYQIVQLNVSITGSGPNDTSFNMQTWIDEVYVTYGSVPSFASPRETGDSTIYKAACNTCHQFGPRDDSLSNTTYGNPTTGSNADQYFYPSRGGP
jgi:hypothetical protein